MVYTHKQIAYACGGVCSLNKFDFFIRNPASYT